MYSILFALANAYTSPSLTSADHQSCPADTPISCSGSSTDTCCYEGTNGVFLSTQFWDYNPATGPADAFTLHGLWSDKCSGGYNQFCNPSWEISGVRSILTSLGKTDLLAKMDKYWKNYDGTDDDLWEHEFNKHGTCMATLNPDCYPSSDPQEYVGDFYTSTFSLYESLPTYQWLTAAGITPDNDKTHNVADIQNALSENFNGKSVYLGCDSSNNLQEVWYFYSLQGSVASGQFTPIDSVSTSSCKDGLKWIPKKIAVPITSTDPAGSRCLIRPSTAAATATATSSGTKGSISIEGKSGCLISNGKWFTSGTCATFTVTSDIGGVSITSSKGPCGIVSGAFTCGSDVTASDFELSGGYISYDGSTVFSVDSEPSGQTQETVDAGSGNVEIKLAFPSS